MFITTFAPSNNQILNDILVMKTSAYTQETLVIENPSKGLLDFVNKLRERKLSQQEKLRNKKNCTIKINA